MSRSSLGTLEENPRVSQRPCNNAEQISALRIRSNPADLPAVRAQVRVAAAAVGFSNEDAGQITLAVDEALTNVIRHGYGGCSDQPIDLRFETIRSGPTTGLSITVRDFGRQVAPDSIRGRPLDDVRPGGLGVHIIRSVMDEVIYEHAEDGGMRLIMLKKKSTP